jgi:hypothetical protein
MHSANHADRMKSPGSSMLILNSAPRAPFAAILGGGLVAGTVDIVAAATIYRVSPIRVMKSIAGGLLGRSALAGDASVALLGLFLQWAMSIIIAAIFVIAVRRLPGLLRRWIASGIAYGVVIFVVMNYVVVPLSAMGDRTFPHFRPFVLIENLAAMIVFGLIVACSAHRVACRAMPHEQGVC